MDGLNITLRDTSLLAPTKQSLEAVGKLYSSTGLNLSKVKLASDEINRMDTLMDSDPDKFKEYAIQDSVYHLTSFTCY